MMTENPYDIRRSGSCKRRYREGETISSHEAMHCNTTGINLTDINIAYLNNNDISGGEISILNMSLSNYEKNTYR